MFYYIYINPTLYYIGTEHSSFSEADRPFSELERWFSVNWNALSVNWPLGFRSGVVRLNSPGLLGQVVVS